VDNAIRAFRIDEDSFYGPSRKMYLSTARWVAIYLSIEFSRLSHLAISRRIGRDHSTVFNARDKIKAMIAAGRIPDPKAVVLGQA
jgi:chromosomal replication initiation ATPase DnaA